MAPRLPYVTSSLSQPANHGSSHGRRARAVRSLFFGKERAPSESMQGCGLPYPIFTENPRRVLLGNWAFGINFTRILGASAKYKALPRSDWIRMRPAAFGFPRTPLLGDSVNRGNLPLAQYVGAHADHDARQGTQVSDDERLEHVEPLPISKAYSGKTRCSRRARRSRCSSF